MSTDVQQRSRKGQIHSSAGPSFLSRRIGYRKYLLALILLAVVIALPGSIATMAPQGQVIPTIGIVSVERDASVTVRTANFPANQTFTVTMGAMGTKGIGGIVVGTTGSGTGGTFDASYEVPAALKGAYQIAIRLQSPSGYYAYNWFYNNTTTSGGTGGEVPPGTGTGYVGIPTFSIESVVEDESVTIQTNNFPANRDFVVTMGPMGTRGINGIVVETFNSGGGGSFEDTYAIPPALAGSYRISIRLQSVTGGFFAYNWFYNNTTTGGGTGGEVPPDTGTGYVGIPTFSVQSVVRNESVSIQTNNFPANRDFVVTMGPMGTRGINGIVVETFNSGAGGSFTDTYAIPPALAGSYQISIRLQSVTGGFFAYNWFYNNTTP